MSEILFFIAVGFLSGVIVATVAINYFVVLPLRRTLKKVVKKTINMLDKMLADMKAINEEEKDKDGNIKSPIRYIPPGS